MRAAAQSPIFRMIIFEGHKVTPYVHGCPSSNSEPLQGTVTFTSNAVQSDGRHIELHFLEEDGAFNPVADDDIFFAQVTNQYVVKER